MGRKERLGLKLRLLSQFSGRKEHLHIDTLTSFDMTDAEAGSMYIWTTRVFLTNA